MLKDLWRVLTGRLSWEQVTDLRDELQHMNVQLARVRQLETDLGYAKAAIAELKSQLSPDWEARRKAASDDLGRAALADMQAHPEKFIP